MGNCCFKPKESSDNPLKNSPREKKHLIEQPEQEIFFSEEGSGDVIIRTTLLVYRNEKVEFKKYFTWKKNMKHVLKPEIQVYEEMNKMFDDASPVPKLVAQYSFEKTSELIFSCYYSNLLKLIYQDPDNIISKARSKLKDTLKELTNDLAILSKKDIHHFQINPFNIFVSPEGNIRLQNFIIPESYTQYFDNTGNIYLNSCKYLNEKVINWQAPELKTRPIQYDKEKIDVFAVGELIKLLSPTEESLLHLSQAMLHPNPQVRPTFSKCYEYLKDKRGFPLYILLKNDLNSQQEFFETRNYVCYKYRRQSYGQIFEICQYRLKANGNRDMLLKYVERFERMSRKVSARSSLIKLLHFEIENDVFTTVTDYYENNFERMIKKNRKHGKLYEVGDIWNICTPLLEVFRVLAEKKVLHGDIQPRNLLITPEKTIKVSGFLPEGACLIEDVERIQQLQEFGALLAPEYLEQGLIIAEEIDFFKADVYSLGLTLFEIVSNESALMYSHEKIINRIMQLPNLNDEMKDLLRNMLAQRNQDRYDITSCNKFYSIRHSRN